MRKSGLNYGLLLICEVKITDFDSSSGEQDKGFTKRKLISYIFKNITQPASINCTELKSPTLIYSDSCDYSSHN